MEMEYFGKLYTSIFSYSYKKKKKERRNVFIKKSNFNQTQNVYFFHSPIKIINK